MRMDGKVHGTLIRNKDGREIPEDEFVVFRPHDNALVPTLECYRQHCMELGVSQEQLLAIEALMERVAAWRYNHPERCKVADVQPGELQT